MITKEQACTLSEVYDAQGKRWRRNGRTQVWVTRPAEFRFPVKFGLYAYDAITQESAHLVFATRDEAVAR